MLPASAAPAAGVDLVVTAGVAEFATGSIAMGLGGYLAARSEREHYASAREREEREIVEKPEAEELEVAEIFAHYGLTPEHYVPLIAGLRANPVAWRDFMMRFELGLEQQQPQRARWSASTIAGAYVVGGLIPLPPYLLSHTVARALPWSIAVTLAALAVFGYIKGRFTGTAPLKSSLQTLLVGGAAAAVALPWRGCWRRSLLVGNSSTSACQATTGPLMPTPKLILGDVPSCRGQQVLRRPLKNAASKPKFAAGHRTFTGVQRGAAARWAAQ